jgi:hypothetical protein
MAKRRLTALVLLLAGFAGGWLVAPSLGRAAAHEEHAGLADTLVLIVARDLGLRELSSAVVRRVFLGEPTEAAGRRLLPFNYATENPLRRDFDRVVLEMSPGEVGRYWVDRRIRGEGLPPRTVPSPAVARAVVTHLLGAIAYVTADQLDASVVALRIDGRDYSDPSYPLQLHRR